MGICLDTDQQNGSQVFEEGDARATGRWRGEAGLLATPPDGHFPKQNVGPVKFEVPKVPVIFVLGGPGSGKVTYCDNLIQERQGITHINMMDLLQQYALGNDMQDFGQLSSKTVTEVLMLEMKMSPGAKVFLVSGYPRNMRDVVEYAEKIKIVNGVILVSWRQEVLERQIDFGAQLGHVIIGLARMELHNFYRNVMPVAEYFDQSGMLLEVNGERNPSEVYVSFRDAVLRILGMSSGEIRDQNVPQSLEAEVEVERRKESVSSSPPMKQQVVPREITPSIPPAPAVTNTSSRTADKPRKGLPSFIWVIGGPGSNKAALCAQAVRSVPGWLHVSIGGLFRTMASSNMAVNEAIVSGEMVPHDIVMQLVEQQMLANRDSDGIVMDGYPRDLNQVQEFESKFGQEPPLVLLDCSKLQLGRGRLDDSVSAFRKRLELFREVSLPMLKTLDSDNRLTIMDITCNDSVTPTFPKRCSLHLQGRSSDTELFSIDGDTDVPSVQQDFAAALYQLMRRQRRMEEDDTDFLAVKGRRDPNGKERAVPNGVAKRMVNGVSNYVKKASDATKNVNGITAQGVVGTISNGVSNNTKRIQENGQIRQNGIANGAAAARMLQNGVAHLANGIASSDKNKVAPTMPNYLPKDPIGKMYNEVEGYQQNLHM